MQLQTGWSVLLFCELERRKSFCVCACVSSLYGQTGLCSPQNQPLTTGPDAYGNTTVTGNVQHVSLCCCNWARGEGVLERSPPRAEGWCWRWLHGRLGAVQNLPLSGSETSKNTQSMLRYSRTHVWTCTPSAMKSGDVTSQMHGESQTNPRG